MKVYRPISEYAHIHFAGKLRSCQLHKLNIIVEVKFFLKTLNVKKTDDNKNNACTTL